MKIYLKLVLFLFLIILGIFIFIFGGYDDSPGAQLIGVVLFGIGTVKIIKFNKKK